MYVLTRYNTNIFRQDSDSIQYKYNSKTGRLEAVKDLRIRHESLRKWIIEDVTKSFSCTRDLDVHGRLDTLLINIKGYEKYKLRLEYDQANQVNRHQPQYLATSDDFFVWFSFLGIIISF